MRLVSKYVHVRFLTRLHDVPGVLPPRQPRQDAELDAHHAEPEPNEVVRPLVRQLGQLLSPLLERGQLRLQLLDLPYQTLLLQLAKTSDCFEQTRRHSCRSLGIGFRQGWGKKISDTSVPNNYRVSTGPYLGKNP